MATQSTLDDLAGEPFVSLTTFRRDGTPVATPVWIARDGDALVVTTVAGTGKVKRLRRNPRVELRPCSRRGEVPPGAGMASGTAEVVAQSPGHVDALRRKYGLQFRLLTLAQRLVRRKQEDRVILQITLDTPAPDPTGDSHTE